MTSLTTITTAVLTMSSREIAELLGCRHDNVKVTIDTLARKGLVTFTETQEKTLGRPATVYHVGKRDSYVIVAQLSPEFTAKLVDRWQELEAQVAQQSPRLPRNFAEALRLAADLEEQKEQLRLQNEAMKPAAEVGAAVDKRTNITVPDFAKKLDGVNTQQVQNWLGQQGILRKDSTHKWSVRSRYRDVEFAMAYDGQGRSTVIVLEKGQQRLVKAYREGRLPMKKGCTPVLSAVAS